MGGDIYLFQCTKKIIIQIIIKFVYKYYPMNLNKIKNKRIVFFTGAGMSAESGVPTYRGSGGIWNSYKWQEYACQRAFDSNPEHVLDFHQLRRIEALNATSCWTYIITQIQNYTNNSWIVTQNIDGMHQRAKSKNIIELHGSLWELRCEKEMKIFTDAKPEYAIRL